MKMQKLNKNKQNKLKLDSNTKSNSNIKQTENGRSMVEMLGVLAVMAILSMGVYRAYYNSMVKERTNEVIDGGYKRATIVSSQITMNQIITLNEFKDSNKVSGGTFDSAVTQYADKQQFGIKVSGVTKDVCDKIKESISDRTVLRVLRDTEGNDITACTDNIDLMMVYNNNMKAGTESAGSGEGSGEEPEQECDSSKHQIADGAGGCKCEDGYKLEDGECKISCSDGWIKTANNGTKFCKSKTYMDWDDAKTWCEDQGLSLASFSSMCPGVESEPGSTCPNLQKVNCGVVWSSQKYGTKSALTVGTTSGNIDYYTCAYGRVNSIYAFCE